MKKKKVFIFGMVFLCGLFFIVSFLNQKNKNIPELVDVHPVSMTHGMLLEEITTPNMIKNSSDILIGTVISKEPFNSVNSLFSVSVEEVLAGSINTELIDVYVSDNALNINDSYIFFLSEMSSTLYPKDFYVQHPEFILKVEDGNVTRLVDPYSQQYVAPFVDEKYNNLSILKEYLIDNKTKIAANKVKAIDKASNVKELFSLSDNIIEVKVVNVLPGNDYLSTVEFQVTERYKGNKDFGDLYSTLLPMPVNPGENYLLFLVNNKEGGNVTLTTREGSITHKDSIKYTEIIQQIQTNK